MKVSVSVLVLLAVLLVVGCTMVAMKPVPVGVSGAAVDRPAESGGTPMPHPSSLGQGGMPSLQTRPAGLRGEILFPRYDYLNVPPDAIAEVWIDDMFVGPVQTGVGKMHEVSSWGIHTFSVQVYRHERPRTMSPRYAPGRRRPDYRGQEERKIYVGCSRGQFNVEESGSSTTLLYGIFWRLVIPPPTPEC